MMMRILLLFFSTLYVIHCSCPTGFDLVSDGECRGKYGSVSMKWNQALTTAIEKCKEVHAQPIIIHSEEQQLYWSARTINITSGWLPIGLTCNKHSKQWEWIDGSAVDYKPPLYNSVLDRECTTGFVWGMEHFTSGRKWTGDSDASREYARDIFCIKQLQSSFAGNCEGFEEGVCYQIGRTTENWADAKRICRGLGADLASIHNSKENKFIHQLAVLKKIANGLFIGSTAQKKDDFYWTDGTEFKYSNFYTGFPSEHLGECLAMDTQSSSGEWVNTNCSSRLHAVCKRKEKKPVCPSGPWQEGEIITSPGFPSDASVPCDYIFVVPAHKRVELEIIMLEANSCCDNLILRESYIGSHLVSNVTGKVTAKTYATKSSNYMRVSWRPNGGVNVKGVMMTFRGV